MSAWTIPDDVGLWDIPAFWLLLAFFGFTEITLLNLSAETLLVAAFTGCARAVQKRTTSRPNSILSMLQGIGLWCIRLFPILPIAVGHYMKATERWFFLVLVAQIVTTLTTLGGKRKAEWPGRPGSLRRFIVELDTALLATTIWGSVRYLAIVPQVPGWVRQALPLPAAILLPYNGNQWRLYAGLLCGAYQAFDIQRSLKQASNSSIEGNLSNQTNSLVRRCDNTTVNPYLPPIVGAFIGAFIGAAFAVLLWYVGPHQGGGNSPSANHPLPQGPGANPPPGPQQGTEPNDVDEAGGGVDRPIELHELDEWVAEGDLGIRHGEEGDMSEVFAGQAAHDDLAE